VGFLVTEVGGEVLALRGNIPGIDILRTPDKDAHSAARPISASLRGSALRRCTGEFKMKKLLTIAALLIFSSSLHASVIGLLTSDACDWGFVQKTGGIRISNPIKKDGKTVLPVEYDVSGLTTVTRKPTLMNSGLTVRKICLKRDGAQIIVRVVTQVAEKGTHAGHVQYADLDDFPPGKFRVYYETTGDAEKNLGEIEIK
jgi:hypothetical protein